MFQLRPRRGPLASRCCAAFCTAMICRGQKCRPKETMQSRKRHGRRKDGEGELTLSVGGRKRRALLPIGSCPPLSTPICRARAGGCPPSSVIPVIDHAGPWNGGNGDERKKRHMASLANRSLAQAREREKEGKTMRGGRQADSDCARCRSHEWMEALKKAAGARQPVLVRLVPCSQNAASYACRPDDN